MVKRKAVKRSRRSAEGDELEAVLGESGGGDNLADFVRSLAAEANAAVDTWAPTQETTSKSQQKKLEKEEREVKRKRKAESAPALDPAELAARTARLEAQAEEDAEICGGSSDEDDVSLGDDTDEENSKNKSKLSREAKREKERLKEVEREAKRKARARARQEANREAKLKAKAAAEAEAAAAAAEPAEGAEKKDGKKRKAGSKADASDAEEEGAPSAAQARKQKQVWLGDLPWSADAATVREDFSKFGEMERFHFPLDKAGRPQGFAHILYKDQGTAKKVLTLDGIDYKGRKIRVRARSPRRRNGVRSRASGTAAPPARPEEGQRRRNRKGKAGKRERQQQKADKAARSA